MTAKIIDINAIDQIIREVGIAEIMPRFQKLAAGDVEMKGKDDPVTIADKETERVLTERLTAHLPGSVVVGEETFAKDKSIMSHLDGSQYVWIIDPIDGTRNFVSGKPEFATMIALVRDRSAVAAWIHDPNTGDTLQAETGSGVWLRGQKLKLVPHDAGYPAAMLMGSRVKKIITDPSVMPNTLDMPPIQIGSCAGFDYPRLFDGTVNFANSTAPKASYLLYRHTNAWDHVPGMFLHQEAGGYSADWSGKPYNFADNMSGLLYAPNKDEWNKVYSWLSPIIEHTRNKTALGLTQAV